MLLVATIVHTACEEMAGGVNASYSGPVSIVIYVTSGYCSGYCMA